MKDVALEKIINDNLNGIIDTIVFCCGSKYEKTIKDRLKNVLIYVYSDAFQEQRIKEIDLLDIAMDFAKDLTINLNVSEEKKEELNLIVGNIIFKYSKKETTPNNKKNIEKELNSISEFKTNLKDNVELIVDLLEHYKKDYELKKLIEQIENVSQNILELNKTSIKIKKETLKRYCNIDCDNSEVEELWSLLSSFKSEMDSLLDEMEYRKEILSAQAKLCKRMGAIGDSAPEIIVDARNKNLFLDSSIISIMENYYQVNYEKAIRNYMSRVSNIDRILAGLRDNGIEIDEKFVRSYLSLNNSVSGVQIVDVNGDPACIIFNNDIYLYSQDFINTYIHELVHYMGGSNELICKRRLIYNNDPRYVVLDEAFTNYLANEGKKEYLRENNLFFPIKKNIEGSCIYDCTLEYMGEVFKLYKDELIKIHLSDTVELRKAKLWCPIEDIANSVYKIYKASRDTREQISKQEIQKLVRGDKR